ncbi:MAG: iron-containing alcohol dehydrogenase [Spartobacteria bacterium]|nr:iron-containing alcohol dehydrogenase [Spartobacteria bacterium]
MTYNFSTPKVVFGRGTRARIAGHAVRQGRRCLLVTGGNPDRHDWLHVELRETMAAVVMVRTPEEPDTLFIREQLLLARDSACDVVVAIGGGSALDTGKALAALLTNTSDLFTYLEVVGRGLPLETPSRFMIAVPTTAGSGAEVTANAVLAVPDKGLKVSLRGPAVMPDLAIVDPELAISLPSAQTAPTGLDALTQLIEAFVSNAASPLTDPLCRDGIERASRSLRLAVANGEDLDARTDLAMASLFSGMALANARLGAVHGFAAPLGGVLRVPHGVVCAALLPQVMEVNIWAMQRRDTRNQALGKYTEIARILTGNPSATPVDGVTWIRQLCSNLGIVGLGPLGLAVANLEELADKAAASSSMRGNPVPLTRDELLFILRRAM